MDNWKESTDCYYETPGEFLWFYVLGGCGCGSSDYFQKEAWKLFKDIAEDDEDKWNVYDYPIRELLAHWFDSEELTDHGTSIRGAWLTDSGKELYEYLKKHPKNI